MISIYSSAFNLIKNNFDYFFSINKFCSFADEVVISVNSSQDDTLDTLIMLTKKYSNLIIVPTNVPYSDPLLDGKVKNLALQNTTQPIKIGLDMDEYIPLWQKNIWYYLASLLLSDKNFLCYMIPSINLYGDCYHYSSITPKWYMHKSGLFRGPVNFAKIENGYIDTNKSDTCELIDPNGNLVPSKMTPADIIHLRSSRLPFVVHTGYLSFSDRLLRNNNFWKNHWLVESGGKEPKHKVHNNMNDFTEHTDKHLLDIEYET